MYQNIIPTATYYTDRKNIHCAQEYGWRKLNISVKSCYLCPGGITCMTVCLFVHLYLCLLKGLHKYYWFDLPDKKNNHKMGLDPT